MQLENGSWTKGDLRAFYNKVFLPCTQGKMEAPAGMFYEQIYVYDSFEILLQ